METTLKILFPMVFGQGVKSSEVAKQIYAMVINYLNNQKSADDCIYPKTKDREWFLKQFAKTQQNLRGVKKGICVKFMCQYGCAILINKQQVQSSISIEIVRPQEWTTGSNSCKTQKLQFCEPKSQSTIFTPQLSEYEHSLEKFVLSFSEKIDRSIKYQKEQCERKEQTYKYSIEQIEKAVKMAQYGGAFKIFYRQKQQSNPQQNNPKQQQKKQNIQLISNQNIDFSYQNTNTSWYVVQAVLRKLIREEKNSKDNKLKCDKLLIGFRSSILEKTIREKINNNHPATRNDIINFKRCLDELIFLYRAEISKATKKNERFLQIIKRIQKLIVEAQGGRLTSKFDDKYFIQDEIKMDPQGIPTINRCKKIQHEPQIIQKAKIQQFSYQIDSRLPFQSLLDMHGHYVGNQLWEKLTQYKRQSFLNHWVLLVQKTLFKISQQISKKDDGNKNYIDLDIHMREIQCQIGASNLCSLIILYESIVSNNKIHYGMGLESQINSHLQLIKTIGAVIAFESVKMNRQRKKSNLKNYRVPLDIGKLYNNFISHDYLARRAMTCMNRYYKRREKLKPLFELTGDCKSFAQFGSLVGEETRSAHVWIDGMERILKLQKQKIIQNIKLSQSTKRIGSLETTKNNIKSNSSNNLQFNYDNDNWKTQQTNCHINEPLRNYSQNEKWLYAFVHNIPPDVLGYMKIAFYAQNPQKKINNKINNDNQFQALNTIQTLAKQKLPIYIYNLKPTNLNAKYISSGEKDIMSNIRHTQPLNNIKILYKWNQKDYEGKQIVYYGQFSEGIKEQMFRKYVLQGPVQLENPEDQLHRQLSQRQLKQFLNPPKDVNMQRQHEVYAYQYLKPRNLQIQQFLALSNIRSAQETQIILLCENILQRKLIPNCYDTGNAFKQQVFLQTAGQLCAYKFKTENYFGMLKKLIRELQNIWIYSDTNFCPVIGPFIAFVVRQLNDNEISEQQYKQLRKTSLKIAQKCWKQFKRGQQQLREDPQLKIYWDQRFIITAALCCFREFKVTQDDVDQIIFLIKLIFQMRTTKIFSDRQEKPQNKRSFQKERQYSLQKTIFSNIQVISQFIFKNQHILNEILTELDEGFPKQIDWQKIGIYELIGTSRQSQDFYQIDLYRGCFFKNGKQLSALDPKIKQNSYFKKIFNERQFQVYPSNNLHYMRTKNNLNHQFKVNKDKEQIFFQFSEDGNNIRYISKKAHLQGGKCQQQIWQLIKFSTLNNSKVHLPQIFLKNHYAWLCEQKNCIVFRKIKFEQIYDIGLVIHLTKHSDKKYQISKALHIVFHNGFNNQNLDEICDFDNVTYQQLILRSKDKKLDEYKPYEYLSKLQNSKYVFQLRNQKTNEIHFLLHRYQLRFKLQGNELISESHYGYSIDFRAFEIKNSIFQKFPCLVLKKDFKNLMILNSHKRIIIVSDGHVQKNGKIKELLDPALHIDSYRYDIHDFFGDIRGSTRQSQLHMVALMLSIDDNMRIQSVEMTPLELGIHILKTCFSNRPFTEKQNIKINNIIELANDQVLLFCQTLIRGSKQLHQILPFPKENVKLQKYQSVGTSLRNLQNNLLKDRTLYKKKVQQQKLSYRQQISQNMLNFIGFKVKQTKNMSNEKSEGDSSSSDEFEEQQFWKGIQVYNGQGILQAFPKIQDLYSKLCFNTRELDLWCKDNPQMQKADKLKFPEQIEKNAIEGKDSQMMNQLMQQIKVSYESFAKEQNKLKNIKEQFSNNNYNNNIILIEKLKRQSNTCIKQIEQLIHHVKIQNDGHPDIITGFRPTLSQPCYTCLICNQNEIYNYYPKIRKAAAQKLKLAIKIWMDLKTRVASYERIQILLKNQKPDIVALLRQIESPRKQIFEKTPWICFQTQMKIQIWPSQYETYENLMAQPDKGPFCQLNMGQGKTQVIIPMIILNIIFGSQKFLPRINLLTSLFEQARGNMFKFLSVTGFQIPGFQIPFSRKVILNKHNIYAIRDIMNCFQGKAYLLVNRESRLSQILRYYQYALQKPDQKININTIPLLNCQLFDIFDEIDAMMTPKKSYIFSIGKQIQLPSAVMRLEIQRQCLEIVLLKTLESLFKNKMATSDETQEDAIQSVRKGQYPDGFRLIFQNIPQDKIIQWKKDIAETILKDKTILEYSFIHRLQAQQINNLVQYCVNPLAPPTKLSKRISQRSKDQIYILRGLLAYGILQHCLSKRCGVDYGVPGPQHLKKIAVPYQAADIPSKTSEYEHPQVSAVLSYIAYNMRGLTEKQFQQSLKFLVQLTPTSMEAQYKKWILILSAQTRNILVIDKANKINFNSKADKMKLYSIFKKNRKTIAFWLNKCVFPRDLKQYKFSICSSSFDLADVQRSVGFSGTMDNHWILPNKIKFTPCQTPSIKGTDGKMIHLMTKFTKQISLIAQNQRPLWQRFVESALQKEVGCLIDVGAICVGKSLKNQIVPWIAQHEKFDSQKYSGISFCDQNGKWQVYDIQAKYYINRGTTIPDHKTFVVFDEARTRGADLKMDSDVVAAVSLGPNLTKDKFMQAAGRLRKLGRNQSIVILATHEVFSTLPTFPKQMSQIDKKLSQLCTQKLTQLVLAWCCQNTIHENQNLLLQYSNLGWKYVYTKVNKVPLNQQIFSTLQNKYEAALQTHKVSDLSKLISSKKTDQEQKNQTGRHLCKVLQKYGKSVLKQSGTLDDVCQREVEAQKQQQKEQQDGFYKLKAIPEQQKQKLVNQLKGTPYKFAQQFKMTNNFILTTKAQQLQKFNQNDCELPQCYFVKYNQKQFILISLREASEFIKANILNDSMNNYKLSLLRQLSIQNDSIKEYGLQQALVSAKFISGKQNYNVQELQYLTNFLLRSLRAQNKEKQSQKKMQEDIVSIILKMRRIHHKKFGGSTLQKMITKLANQDLSDNYKQQMKEGHSDHVF